jgi:eukaryotic-like serine/threonine-protein kinase
MIFCLNRIGLFFLSLGLMAALVSSVPAQNKDKKDKKPATKKEDKEPEPKKEPVKEKPDVPLLTCKGHTYWVNQVVFSTDGKQSASAGRDRSVRVWDAPTAKEIKTFKDLPRPVRSVAFVPDGRVAATAGKWDKKKKAWEGEILIFDLKSAEPASLKGHSDEIESLAVSGDGKKLASAGDDHTALLWDLAAGKVLHTLKGHTDAILSVTFSKNGTRVATASKDKTVKIWDVTSGKDLLTLKNPPPVPEKKAPEPKKAKEEKKTEKKGKEKGKAKAKGKAKDQKAKQQPPLDPTRDMTCVAFNPAGDRVAASNLDGTIKIWDAAKGKQLLNIKAGGGLWSVAYSPDGKRIAAGGWDELIYVFDAGNGKTLFTLRAHENTITSVAFSPDGSRMASASLDQTIKIWSSAPPKKR